MATLSSDWKFFDVKGDNKLFISPRSDGKAILLSPLTLETKGSENICSFDFTSETLEVLLSVLESFLATWKVDSYITYKLNNKRIPITYKRSDKSIIFTDSGFSFMSDLDNKNDCWTYLTPANCQKFVYLLRELKQKLSLQNSLLEV